MRHLELRPDSSPDLEPHPPRRTAAGPVVRRIAVVGIIGLGAFLMLASCVGGVYAYVIMQVMTSLHNGGEGDDGVFWIAGVVVVFVLGLGIAMRGVLVTAPRSGRRKNPGRGARGSVGL